MAKRKVPDGESNILSTPSKKSRKSTQLSTNESSPDPKSITRTNLKSSREQQIQEHEERIDGNKNVATQISRVNGVTPTTTPSKGRKALGQTPSRTTRADQSAKKKSAEYLAGVENDGNDWEEAAGLASEILNGETNKEDAPIDTIEVAPESGATAKKARGRPKGAKNKRSPTPEGDLPPEERYFFQTRTGPTQLSSNPFSKLGLLNHEEYFDHIRKQKDGHEAEMEYLLRLHSRSFPQWLFELEEGFSLCLYGLGSKRPLLQKFAQWLHQRSESLPLVVIVNGYTSKLNIRSVLNIIYSAVATASTKTLTGQPRDILDSLLKQLQESGKHIFILVNSLDGPSLRRGSSQSLFANLAAHENVHFVATTDTPTFQLLWNSNLKDQFRFVYHDATTFAPYDSESNPVDDVNELLGRKGRRVGGKEGIGFVLKSLPENARNLYRVLLTEILSISNDGFGDGIDNDENAEMAGTGRKTGLGEDIGVEYRSLYQKASEEFICSSDMNFRFLLKEFHDHQMITSRRDGSGMEILGVPLAKDEMEGVLEDLVVG